VKTFDPDNPKDLTAIRKALTQSRHDLEVFRGNRIKTVRHLVGNHYSEDGATDREALGFLQMAAGILLQQLAARSPKALVVSAHDDLKVLSHKLQLRLNDKILDVKLHDVIQRSVLEAVVLVGLVKVGLENIDEGEPETFVSAISPDDWIFDTSASHLEGAEFMGYRYRVPYEMAKEMRRFRKKARDELGPKREIIDDADERVSDISFNDVLADEFTEKIELWDLWLPRSNLILTLPDSGQSYLEAYEWGGPPHGPFHVLSYGDVPDNIMPLSPLAGLMDLHELINQLFNKFSRQVLDAKTVYEYVGGAEEEARRKRDAIDGEILRVNQTGQTKAEVLSSVNPQSYMLLLQAKELFNYTGGNLELLGGLGASSETLGQDQILSAGASKRLQDMQARTTKFVKEILKDLAWYEWHNPTLDAPLNVETPAGTFQDTLTAEDITGDFLDHRIDIIPHSMQELTPPERLQFLYRYVREFAIPTMPISMQQHQVFNFKKFNRLVAEYSGMPEVEDLFMSFEGSPDEEGGNGAATKPPSTTRHVSERVGRPGPSRSGRDHMMEMAMMGKGSGGSQGQE